MARKQKLWLDNDVLNYFCKAGCLQQLLAIPNYDFATTSYIQLELEEGVRVGINSLNAALAAIQQGVIQVYDTNVPPLCNVPIVDADESLRLCVEYYGDFVLTHDKSLIKDLRRANLGCIPFKDFLQVALKNGWLNGETVNLLGRLAGI
jgi:rRNA-processing protein FCF1